MHKLKALLLICHSSQRLLIRLKARMASLGFLLTQGTWEGEICEPLENLSFKQGLACLVLVQPFCLLLSLLLSLWGLPGVHDVLQEDKCLQQIWCTQAETKCQEVHDCAVAWAGSCQGTSFSALAFQSDNTNLRQGSKTQWTLEPKSKFFL